MAVNGIIEGLACTDACFFDLVGPGMDCCRVDGSKLVHILTHFRRLTRLSRCRVGRNEPHMHNVVRRRTLLRSHRWPDQQHDRRSKQGVRAGRLGRGRVLWRVYLKEGGKINLCLENREFYALLRDLHVEYTRGSRKATTGLQRVESARAEGFDCI